MRPHISLSLTKLAGAAPPEYYQFLGVFCCFHRAAGSLASLSHAGFSPLRDNDGSLVPQWGMPDVDFTLRISVLKKGEPAPRGIHVDGISILSKPYRAEVKLSGTPPPLSDQDTETLRDVVREILGILMRAKFNTHQVNKMKFRIAL